MGFNLGNLAKVGLSTAAGFATGGPAGAFVGFTGATRSEQEERARQ